MNRGLLVIGAGAAALYFMSRSSPAAINPATGLPYSWNPPPGVNPALWASQPSGVPGYTNGQLRAAIASGAPPGSPVARAIAAMGPGGLASVIGGGASLLSRLFSGGGSDTSTATTVGSGSGVSSAEILRPTPPAEDPWGTGGYSMPPGITAPVEDPWGTGGYEMPAGLPADPWVAEAPLDVVPDFGGLAGLRDHFPWTTGFDHRGDFDRAALGRTRIPSQFRGPI